jgi:hypothetical protein
MATMSRLPASQSQTSFLAGHHPRLREHDGPSLAAVTPEGIEGSLLFRDGRFVGAGDLHWALYPLAGGPPRPSSGIIDDDEPLHWDALIL